MQVCVLSDTHNRHEKLTLSKCDLLIHAGDFSTKGKMSEIAEFAKWFGSQHAEMKVVVPGNHDYACQKYPEAVRVLFRDFGSQFLIDDFVMFHKIKIYGSPWQPWFYDWAFNFKGGAEGIKEAKERWSRIHDSTDILVTHGPPRGILDTTYGAQHAGCQYLLKRIEEIKPKYHICGHIHEGYGMDNVTLKHTTVFNASICTRAYEPTNLPFYFEYCRKTPNFSYEECQKP